MSPNLSFEHIALVLALAGCSKATPAAESTSVRSDPQASAQPVSQGATPPPPAITATAIATTAASPAPGGGAASATELRKKEKNIGGGDGHTGQASCGAGSCTSEIKKK